jgi:hypothetical protein
MLSRVLVATALLLSAATLHASEVRGPATNGGRASQAWCPPGEKLLGGGYRQVGGSHGHGHDQPVQSSPIVQGPRRNGWQVISGNRTSFAAYATCRPDRGGPHHW